MTNKLLFPLLSVRQPLLYFGGKSRAIDQLMTFVPPGTKEVVSPFIGSGSFELGMTNRGIRIYGYDADPLVVIFWEELLANPNVLIPLIKYFVQQFHDGKLDLKYDIYQGLETNTQRAAMFICKQNLSFNGLGTHMLKFQINDKGEPVAYNRPVARKIKFERIQDFYNPLLTVNLADFRESLVKHPDTFAYIDPPYPGTLCKYGDSPELNQNFPHSELADILYQRKKWILSYNDCDLVKTLYPPTDFRYNYPKWMLGSRKKQHTKDCNEVLIRPKE